MINENNIKILEEIASKSSKNDKIELAKRYNTDMSFKELVELCYNPFIQFGVKKVSGKHFAKPIFNEMSIKEYLLYLSTKPSANDEDIRTIAGYLNKLDDSDLCLLFMRLLKKDLKVGMNSKSWIKAGYDIPIFEVQLAQPQSHINKFLQENESFYIQYKLDGNRIIAKVDNGEVVFLSRTGRTVNSLDFFKEKVLAVVSSLEGAENRAETFTFDGEILHNSMELSKCQEIVSKKDSTHGRSKELKYHIFDILKCSGEHTTEYSLEKRLDILNKFSYNEYVTLVPTMLYKKEYGDASTYIWDEYHKARSLGYEGLILKAINKGYEGKRSRNWVKMKPHETMDLEVIRLEQGKIDTKNEHRMGGAIVLHKGVEVSVGGGWSDKEREYYWNNPNELIGKVIEIRYMMITPDNSLLHPRKIRIRDDKIF